MKSESSREPRIEVCRHVLAGLNKEGGGPSYSVPALARAVRPFCSDLELWTLQFKPEDDAPPDDIFIRSFPKSPLPLLSTLCSSPQLHQSIGEVAEQGGIIHNHGLWLLPNLYPAWHLSQNARFPAKIVHSPRGMLGVEARRISAWKKEPIWWLWQKKALAAAHCLHATAESEYEEIRQAGLLNPVAIIPNGIDLPLEIAVNRQDRSARTILSLGRIHPKKGLDRLVRAWAILESSFPDWDLKLVGNAEVGHDHELRALALSLGLKRFSIEPPAYGNAKWAVYQGADLFVLPTLNENFGITVAEALACELPVISTKGAPWEGLVKERCGWWIDHGVDALVDAMKRAMTLPAQERATMGIKGRAWMARDFGWAGIGMEMASVYYWLQNGGDPPASLKLQ
ncbi:MAG: glycosyltransferase [Rhodocyclaceae bacterium]|nr:hypothetical protein AEM38_13905 [Hyphomonadaceae bacterium UKL13-1]MCA3080512.1 glycosyltransferase [Rhodocyclaceae bacterium]HCP64967.1 glycosyltransferase [Hyphomonadaceae bacterium]